VPVVSDEVWRGRADVLGYGESGFVFPRGDVTALAGILRGILTDRQRLQHMRATAGKRMEAWSPRENLEALIQAVWRGSCRRGGVEAERRRA
jgi:glycosyltransferase involved in cell wall biosynthesis